MTVTVSQDELKDALQTADVTALIVTKIKDAKTEGLDTVVEAQLAALFPNASTVVTDASTTAAAATDVAAEADQAVSGDATAVDETAVAT